MQRANQLQLLQSTNVGLLNIRLIELNYYTGFYTMFGNQAALIAGFCYGALSQIVTRGNLMSQEFDEGGAGEDGNYVTVAIYWLASCVCLASSLHLLLVTVMLQVLGPGACVYVSVLCVCVCVFNAFCRRKKRLTDWLSDFKSYKYSLHVTNFLNCHKSLPTTNYKY